MDWSGAFQASYVPGIDVRVRAVWASAAQMVQRSDCLRACPARYTTELDSKDERKQRPVAMAKKIQKVNKNS